MLLGCIGDDFTGSSDIANTLAKGGMRVTQYSGVPKKSASVEVEAGVVSLKSRTAPIQEAVEDSLEAARWLLDQGCEQIFFKYCSTFDSTKEGNIGPVADALAEFLNEDQVLFCPAFPATGRSIYQGNLFVNDIPLHESGMKDHPLTPMTDSDLRRWLAYQTKTPVKHIPHSIVSKGAENIATAFDEAGPGYFIADAIDDDHLIQLGKAAKHKKLLTGGSGLALGLPENFRTSGKINHTDGSWQGISGAGVVLSGSCSQMTRKQVEMYRQEHPSQEVTAERILDDPTLVAELCDWALSQTTSPLIYSSADPTIVRAAQGEFGQEFIAGKIEGFFGMMATRLVELGVKKLVSAGGETSGAIVSALKIDAMEIGPEIAPGVPALKDNERNIALALKSGNFGDEEFFEKAIRALGK
ncbi:MAG: four-carbon acid sugar kinase family protein [Rhizobiaceae bacterium]|nr:four-carbon acid sugar kinase family protein [Rhizobiaceae bacterium]